MDRIGGGGGFGGGRSSRGSFGSNSTYRLRPRTSTHVHYHRGLRRGFSILLYIMAIIIVAMILGFSSYGGNTSGIPKSTKGREPL